MTIRNEALIRELMQTFQAEALEHITTLNQSLLTLERLPTAPNRAAMIQEVFRAAHSLKGAARAVDLQDVATLAHHLEDLLKKVRDDGMALTPANCDVLYLALDVIQKLVKGESVDIAEVAGMLMRLNETTAASDEPIAASAPSNMQAVPGQESDEVIRVAVSKMDALMAQTGELLAARISARQRTADMKTLRQQVRHLPRLMRDIKTTGARLKQGGEDEQQMMQLLHQFEEAVRVLTRDVNHLDMAINRDALRMGMVTGRIQDEVRRVRMVSFQMLEPLFQRAVRDAARVDGKDVELIIEGGSVELDKKVQEALKTPLLHLLRNAVSHGIETPEIRQQHGKAVTGKIHLHIMQRGSEAYITLQDDGAGFDLEKLKQSAEARHALPGSLEHVSDVINLAFLPGVTTAARLSSLSGRGVGLDVVRQEIEALQGRILVENKPQQGAMFRLIVPVSLAMTRVLLVTAGRQRFALPLASVMKIVKPKNLFQVEGQAMLTVDNQPVRVVPLVSVMNLPLEPGFDSMAVIVAAGEQTIALLVNDILTEQELAVKPLSKPIVRLHNVTGAAIMGSGEPIVVLNVADLAKSARRMRVEHIPAASETESEMALRARILVVDDSITTRTLEKNILEAAGFEVITATDGIQALEQLNNHEIHLVVADVEMPNMDGITLTCRLRDSKEYQDLPLILVTSLESAGDRERGMNAGANAYIVKRGFNQAELLSTIRQYLQG